MTRYIVGILVVVGLGWWGYSLWRDHAESEQKRVVRETTRDALKVAVAQMGSKVNAVTDWAASLTGDKKIRSTPVLTAELQKLWVIERPILFVGNVEDIAINQDGTYQVIVEHNWTVSQHRLMGNTIRIALDCPESVATSLVQAMKGQRRPMIGPDMAITGRVQRIVTTSQKDSEGDTVTALTGVGTCLNAMHLDDRISW